MNDAFWTLSAWQDQASLSAAVGCEPHREIMKRFRPRMAGSSFVTWTAPATALPIGWGDALRRLDNPDTVRRHDPKRPHWQRGRHAGERKGQTMTGPDLDTQDVIDALDSFYCYNIVAALWADAVANRLEGLAIYLLSDELPEVAAHARAAATRLAGRIGDLGGAITADPRQLTDRAPGDIEFAIPDCSDPRAITTYALQRLNIIIGAYQEFLDKVRGRDDVSFALVVGLLAAETHRWADITAALAQ